MNSAVIKRSVVVAGNKTSISLEETFWQGLKEIAVQKRLSLGAMLDMIAEARENANLSSAIRQYVMQYYYDLVMKPAHQLAAGTAKPHFVMIQGH